MEHPYCKTCGRIPAECLEEWDDSPELVCFGETDPLCVPQTKGNRVMSKFRKKPVVIEATQWFKNGDHPDDYAKDTQGLESGELRTFTGAERHAQGWEGDVVRYFRRPDVKEDQPCKHCGSVMRDHGWIDTLEGGHVVCPGDWIITGVQGERYPCKPDIFEKTYEPEVEVASAPIDVPYAMRDYDKNDPPV